MDYLNRHSLPLLPLFVTNSSGTHNGGGGRVENDRQALSTELAQVCDTGTELTDREPQAVAAVARRWRCAA